MALLRGINVGGHQVSMARLRSLFEELGFEQVRSYIQTGNIFFQSPDGDREALRQRIDAHLAQALGWAAPSCLRTISELEAMLARDPFAGIELLPERRFAVTFLPSPHRLNVEFPYWTPKRGYELVGATLTEAFVVWHLQNGRPGNDAAALDKAIGVTGTTRFWHTTAKILAAAKKTGS